jgi:hypothetical protein
MANAADILSRAAPYLNIASDVSQRYGVPKELMLAMLEQESKFNPVAVSPAGAKGIAQFMPATAQRFGVDAFKPSSAIEGMGKYLQTLGGLFNNDPTLMAAAYNAGEGRVQKANGVPQIPETQNYVKAVSDNLAALTGANAGTPVSSAISATPAINEVDVSGTPAANGTPGLFQGVANPASLVPQTPVFGKGMQGLLTALASIGALGGTAANIIGAIKRSGSPGNEAIKQSGDILGALESQKKIQQAQQDMQQLATNPDLTPAMQTLAAVGGRQALTQNVLSQANANTPGKQLELQRLQQEVDANTPEGKAQALRDKLQEYALQKGIENKLKDSADAEDAKTLVQLRALGENATPEQATQRQILESKLKAAVPEPVMSKLTNPDPNTGLVAAYNKDYQTVKDLDKIQAILTKFPAEQAARFQGGIQNYLQKAIPDADRAELQQVEFILSRAIVRGYIGERGKVPVQEYGNAKDALLNLLSKSEAERSRLLGNLREVYSQNAKTQYNQINLYGRQYFGNPKLAEDPGLGVLGAPSDFEAAKAAPSADNNAPTSGSAPAVLPAGWAKDPDGVIRFKGK